MWAGGNRWTRIAGLTASKPSSTAELRQTTRVPSALFTVFAASAGFDVLGELGDKLADGVDGQLTERERAKGRHEALAPGDLVAGPGAGLQVRTAPGKPPLPIAAEGLPGMPHLAALDLLDQPAPGVARGSLARSRSPASWSESRRCDGIRIASAHRRQSGTSTHPHRARGGRYRHGGRRGRPRRARRRTLAQPPRTGTGGYGDAPMHRASGLPSPLGESSRSRVRPGCCRACQMDVQSGRICHATTLRPPADRCHTPPHKAKKPRHAGPFRCAREDSNLHGPISPQGPQPCASTNSATGA